MNVGDEVISPGSVHSCVTAVFPQGIEPVYEIVFTDGATTQATGDHLWQLSTGDVVATKNLKVGAERGSSLVRLGKVDLGPDPEIGPYLLGAILGDGGLRGPSPTLTSADPEIVERIVPELPAGIHVKSSPCSGSLIARQYRFVGSWPPRRGQNGLAALLRSVGLWGIGSSLRHIPEVAMWSSFDYRLAVLQGLMDTDGCISKDGQMTFCSTSPQLVSDVRALALSLGAWLRPIRTYPAFHTKSGERMRCLPVNATTLFFPGDVTPFHLRRKVDRLVKRRTRQFRRPVSIQYVGDAEVRCIAVSGPSQLYVTRDWIVTHNCFWIAKKREARGDAVTGRVVPSGITGYTGIDDETQARLHEKIDRLRELAQTMGKGVGDAQVTEAFNAQEHGGPYPHAHQYRLATYQLFAHLLYAHGDEQLSRYGGGTQTMHDRHIQIHACLAAEHIAALREADGEHEQVIRDWRPQFTAELEQGTP